MKKKFYLLTTFILISLFLGEKRVWAENLVNYPEKIEIETTDKPSSTRIESNYNFNGYYHTVSPIYEFFDENNNYDKNNDTIKIEKNGISYIKFHAQDMIKDLENRGDISINLVGKANLNEWGGNITPQVFIEAYEIVDNLLSF